MNRESRRDLWGGTALLAGFVLWTAAVCLVDVQAIGPMESRVGLATVNRFFRDLIGVRLWLYELTDFLSLIPLGLVAGFGILGLVQWIRRKQLKRVDRSLLVLGGFYAAVLGAYGLFEILVINYRPVWIEGVLEASYPSSTTVLVLCVVSTAMLQLKQRLAPGVLRRWVLIAMGIFGAFMVVGRMLSGVHWFTDILGGILLSGGLVLLYRGICGSGPERSGE